jgi:hypothetical protein
MIENADRGITINKQLAWTMLTAIVVLVFWGGSTVAGLQSATQGLTATLNENKGLVAAVEGRVRVLENGQSRSDAQFSAMREALTEIKDQNRAIETLLRQMTQSKP